MSSESKLPPLSLEQDDTYEEFSLPPPHLINFGGKSDKKDETVTLPSTPWSTSWADEDEQDDFIDQLRSELQQNDKKRRA
mmetsp:Transcript_16445/g.51435  ORF Transcript_16445/g.51435 Transcript_16445/m.51435 type:complete len:80 (-) Transcript_16445:3127-3366(-)